MLPFQPVIQVQKYRRNCRMRSSHLGGEGLTERPFRDGLNSASASGSIVPQRPALSHPLISETKQSYKS
uniref:Uncharacterized protein n=1 Tax=Anguilla anguilla TaxID=7936 RepID=A0A0E9S2F7_ANGAN